LGAANSRHSLRGIRKRNIFAKAAAFRRYARRSREKRSKLLCSMDYLEPRPFKRMLLGDEGIIVYSLG
jgi:hypothetical protein